MTTLLLSLALLGTVDYSLPPRSELPNGPTAEADQTPSRISTHRPADRAWLDLETSRPDQCEDVAIMRKATRLGEIRLGPACSPARDQRGGRS